MEGAGSRLGRASSRYGPTATVFSGPVRKWKKKWVHISCNSNGSRTNSNNSKNSSTLLLCRWTPISSTTTTTASATDKSDGQPRRKCRYAPIVSLEEKKKDASEKIDVKAKMGTIGSLETETSKKNDEPSEKPGTKRASSDEVQEGANKKQFKPGTSNISNLNLDLELEGNDEDKYDSDGGNMDETGEAATPGQFWA